LVIEHAIEGAAATCHQSKLLLDLRTGVSLTIVQIVQLS